MAFFDLCEGGGRRRVRRLVWFAAVVSGGCLPALPGVEGTTGEALDPSRLDRDADCLLADDCGYPSAGPGYGTTLGDRMENFALIDCEGQQHEFAEFFQPRAATGDYNRAVLFSLGAGWCDPCIEETMELPALYDRFEPQGVEFVQVLFQDDLSAPPTRQFCREWSETFGLEFLVLLDQTGTFFPTYLQMVMTGTPVTIIVDANANIRYRLDGQKPPNLELELERVMAEPYGD